MASREKDQADFDLETFVDLFDTAMSSDNPAVQRALKNLVLISAMVNAQQTQEGLRKGPLRRVIDDIQNLNRRLSNLEGAGAYRSPTTTPVPGTGPWINTTPGQWNPNPGYTQYPSIQPGTLPPGTIISGSSSTDQFKAQAVSQIDVQVGSLLEKLESK